MLVSGLGFQLELTPGSRQPYLASVTRRRWRNYVVGTSIRLACVGLDWARACPSTDSTAARRLKLQGHASTSRQPAMPAPLCVGLPRASDAASALSSTVASASSCLASTLFICLPCVSAGNGPLNHRGSSFSLGRMTPVDVAYVAHGTP
jgi:hypothetical protein